VEWKPDIGRKLQKPQSLPQGTEGCTCFDERAMKQKIYLSVDAIVADMLDGAPLIARQRIPEMSFA
jgi:hypothetical protein